jgi:GGDEF domain-containing protein
MAGCAIGWGKADESLTFSYGIAEYPQDGQAASLLVGAADRAMYGEKGKSEAPALGV